MNKKTLIIMGSSIIGVLVLIILITTLISALGPKYISYQKFEERLTTVSKKYFSDNPSLLPTTDGETTLYYSTLESAEYIEPIPELIENGENCTAQVIVVRNGELFTYIPYLTCPGMYETKELYKAILENNKVTTEGDGLYRGSDSYYFRGDKVNNYIKLDNTLWRIVKVNNDNTITIISTFLTEDGYEWDDRYNLVEEETSGINDFELSRIKETLKALANDKDFLTENMRAKLTARNLCIGKRSLADTSSDNTIECSTLSEDKYYLGLITASEYMAASLDDNCNVTDARSCTNYNYLANNSSTWTLTALSEDSKSAIKVSSIGLSQTKTSRTGKLLVTAYVSNRAFYSSGSGTMEEPYIIR